MKARKHLDLEAFAKRHALRVAVGRIALRGAQALGLVAVVATMIAAPWIGADAKMVYRHMMSNAQIAAATPAPEQTPTPAQPPARPVPVIDVSGPAVVPPIPGMWTVLPVSVSGADSIAVSGLPPILSSRVVGEAVHVKLLSAPPYTPLTLAATVTATNAAGSSTAPITITVGG
ncbi:MAG: hypothetical protein K2Q10_00890 [Rhodospirillales bacterium]|nr:hypothetical protein [Rhodospirillales bacterium]